MEPTWLLIADLHLYSKRLEEQKTTIEWFQQQCKEHRPTQVIFLGDSFHSRSTICIETQKVFKDFINFFQKCDWLPTIHILVGNHDMVNRFERDINTPSLFEDVDKRTYVYSEITNVTMDKSETLFIPYHEDQSIIHKYLSSVKSPENVIVFAHIAVDGTRINGISDNSNNECKNSGLSLTFLTRFKKIFAGHFHHHAVHGNFMYVGSPIMYSFADAEQLNRGCVMYKPDCNTYILHSNPHAVKYKCLTFKKVFEEKDLDVKGKHIKINLDSPLDEFSKLELDSRLRNLGASSIKFKEPEVLVNEEINNIVDTGHDLKSIVTDFVQQQKNFSDEKKQFLIEKCSIWCTDIGVRLENAKFNGNISKVIVHNFLGIRGTKTFDYTNLQAGLYYLQGDNGAGKTTLHDAISYGLFGKLSRSSKSFPINKIINNAATDCKMSVEIQFENGYIVKRKRQKNSGKLEIQKPDGTFIEKGHSRDTDAVLTDLMNIDSQTFERITMLKGRTIVNYFTADDKNKHLIIEKLFGVDIQSLNERCKQDIDKIKEQISDHNRELDQKKNKCTSDGQHLSRLIKEIQTEEMNIKKFDDDLQELKLQVSDLQIQISEAKRYKCVLDNNIKNNEKQYQDLSEKFSQNTKSLYQFKSFLIQKEQENIYCERKLSENKNLMEETMKLLSYNNQSTNEQIKSRNSLEEKLIHYDKIIENVETSIKQEEQSLLMTRKNLDQLKQSIIFDNDKLHYHKSIRVKLDNEVSLKLFENKSFETKYKEIETKLKDKRKIITNLNLDLKRLEKQCHCNYAEDMQPKIDFINKQIQDINQQIETEVNMKQNDLQISQKKCVSSFHECIKNIRKEITSDETHLKTISLEKDDLKVLLQSKYKIIQENLKLHENVMRLEDEKIQLQNQINEKKRSDELETIRIAAHDIANSTDSQIVITSMETQVELPLAKFIDSRNSSDAKVKALLKRLKTTEIKLEQALLSTSCLEDKKSFELQHEKFVSQETDQHIRLNKLNQNIKTLEKGLERNRVLEFKTREKYDDAVNEYESQTKNLRSTHDNLSKKLKKLDKERDCLMASKECFASITREIYHVQKRINEHCIEEKQLEQDFNTMVIPHDNLNDLQHKIKSISKTISDDTLEFNRLQKKHEEKGKLLTLTETNVVELKNELSSYRKNKEITSSELKEVSKVLENNSSKQEFYNSTILRCEMEISNICLPHPNILKDKEKVDGMTQEERNLKDSVSSINIVKKQLLKNMENNDETLESLVNKVNKLENAITVDERLKLDSQDRIQSKQTMKSEISQNIQKYSDAILRLEEISADKREMKTLLDFWKDATSSSKGTFRQFCLQRAIQLINTRLVVTLDELNDGHMSNLKCKIDANLTLQEQNNAVSFEQRSDGEQKITLLAVIFTLMDIIIQNCGFETNILFLDEILDALDQQALYMVEKWISNFTRKKPTLRTFLITHTEIMAAGKSEGIIRAKKDRKMGCSYKAVCHKSGNINFAT